MEYIKSNASEVISNETKLCRITKEIIQSIDLYFNVKNEHIYRRSAQSAESIAVYGSQSERAARVLENIGRQFLWLNKASGKEIKTSRYLDLTSEDDLLDLIDELLIFCSAHVKIISL